jgi:hypothetical protein
VVWAFLLLSEAVNLALPEKTIVFSPQAVAMLTVFWIYLSLLVDLSLDRRPRRTLKVRCNMKPMKKCIALFCFSGESPPILTLKASLA